MTDVRPRAGDIVALVHEQLRNAILLGEIRPGVKTSQAELARDLGVGRTPLREAVRMLQDEGLVLAEPNRRVQIASLSIEDAEELYVMRIALEVAASRITTPRLTRGDIAELEGLMAQMSHLASADSVALFRPPHRAFHERFVAGAGARPAALIAQLFDHAERYRAVYGAASVDRFARRTAEHRAMLDAAAAGDTDGVAEAIAVHYVQTARLVAAALNPEHPLDRLRTTVAAAVPRAVSAFA
jgi:GntR family transcriptional regulator, rspAB operon transcriptional repressor